MNYLFVSFHFSPFHGKLYLANLEKMRNIPVVPGKRLLSNFFFYSVFEPSIHNFIDECIPAQGPYKTITQNISDSSFRAAQLEGHCLKGFLYS